MKSVILLSTVFVFCTINFFPGLLFDKDPEINSLHEAWYSSQLRTLEEPPLFGRNRAKTRYRFTWLRSSHRPIAMRIEVMGNGDAYFFLKIADGRGGHAPGSLVRNERWKLSKQQLEAFESVVAAINFEELPLTVDESGLDGSRWLIEVNRNGIHHLCVRWSPKDGPIREIGMAFIDLATGDFKSIY